MKNITLSISSPHPKFNCKRVSDILKQCGIQSTVVKNYTVMKHKIYFIQRLVVEQKFIILIVD